MKSLTGKFASARGWALVLTLFLGAGLFVAACGDEDVPTPTTPAPTPTPTPPTPPPEPAPEPPATPTGLRISAQGPDFIEWSWTPVPDVSGYDVQYSTNEAFTDEDEIIARTAEQFMYRRDGLAEDTSGYLRVRAAAGTGESRVTSGWSTHVTGMTMAAGPETPPAPANLRVKTRGANFIEWEWDPVPGASGYQSQFSDSSTFPDGVAGVENHSGMGNTTRRVANREPESDGYLRVRTFTGTVAEPTFGDWTAGNMATTEERPPASQLDAPTGLDTAGQTADSVTLEWDTVRNADSYEVRQREPGGAWGNARCGGGDHVVEDTGCVASGLTAGTDYDFEVRAVSSDTDRYTASPWSDTEESRTSGTAPRPTTPVPGGMGGLNVTWEADSDGITWSWEPVAGATYEWKIVSTDLDFDTEDPCGVTGFTESGTEFSETRTDAGPALLCVRTRDEDDDKKDLSWAFAHTVPATAPTVGALTPAGDAGERTRALTWGGIGVPANFRYDIAIVAEGGGVKPLPTGAALQKACSAVSLHETDDTDVPLTGLNTHFRNSPQPHTGYLLCLRYGNQRGDTDWVAAAAKHYTAPGQAPRPAKDNALSTDDPRATSETIVWNVRTRGASDVPRNPDDYNFKVIEHPQRNDGDTDSLHDDTVTRPTTKTCGTITSDTTYTVEDEPTTALTSTGFTVTYSATRPTTAVEVRTTGTTTDILPNIVSLCVQAEYGDSDEYMGPWNVSSSETVAKIRPSG